MNIELLTADSSPADCRVVQADDLSPHLLSVVWAGLAVACSLRSLDDPEAARVAEWFFPELRGFDRKSLSQGLSALIAGHHPPGDVDLAGFSEAHPGLAGYVSQVAHGLFKLSIGIGFSTHGPVVFSQGDCQDLGQLIQFCEATLQEHGSADGVPFDRAFQRLSSLIGDAQQREAVLRLNG